MNKNKIKDVLKPKAIGCNQIIESGDIKPKSGIRYPPKNKITIKVEINIIEPYSAKKK